jgi:hypothetical protein
MQTLDLRVQVVYPVEYIENAIPPSLPAKRFLLQACRQMLVQGEDWSHLINDALFYHPRRLAVALFDKAMLLHQQACHRF